MSQQTHKHLSLKNMYRVFVLSLGLVNANYLGICIVANFMKKIGAVVETIKTETLCCETIWSVVRDVT